MHTLTRADLERITEAAKSITPIKAMIRKAVTGAHLTRELGLAMFRGAPIDPHKHYVIDETVEADRENLLRDACYRSGMEALDDAVLQLKGAYITNRCELRFVRENANLIH